MSDYIQLIYSSIWGYAINIPFPKEPNLPSPITFAEHYAKWQFSMLTAKDKEVENLRIDIKNAKPKVSHIVPPSQTATDNDIQMK